MRLVDSEFWAMNTAARRFFQRSLEFPAFKRWGLTDKGQDILEVGCGSGYGAVLLTQLEPRSYLGIDLMPEMIELARRRTIPNGEFRVMDAADMSSIPSASKHSVVIFGVLHHVPAWRDVIRECHRVLKPGGNLFVEEPMEGIIRVWDCIFFWKHPEEALFTRSEFERVLRESGFVLHHCGGLLGFWSYGFRKE
jgi:ubiquinone/menaquinone biosynthesis C-methylase UbiE